MSARGAEKFLASGRHRSESAFRQRPSRFAVENHRDRPTTGASGICAGPALQRRVTQRNRGGTRGRPSTGASGTRASPALQRRVTQRNRGSTRDRPSTGASGIRAGPALQRRVTQRNRGSARGRPSTGASGIRASPALQRRAFPAQPRQRARPQARPPQYGRGPVRRAPLRRTRPRKPMVAGRRRR